MRSTFLATIAGLVLASSPLLVQRDQSAAAYGQRGRVVPEEVLGKTMVSAMGTEIGRVADLRQGDDGRVEALIVQRQDQRVAVAPEKVQYARNEKVRTSLSDDEVASLPDAQTP